MDSGVADTVAARRDSPAVSLGPRAADRGLLAVTVNPQAALTAKGRLKKRKRVGINTIVVASSPVSEMTGSSSSNEDTYIDPPFTLGDSGSPSNSRRGAPSSPLRSKMAAPSPAVGLLASLQGAVVSGLQRGRSWIGGGSRRSGGGDGGGSRLRPAASAPGAGGGGDGGGDWSGDSTPGSLASGPANGGEGAVEHQGADNDPAIRPNSPSSNSSGFGSSSGSSGGDSSSGSREGGWERTPGLPSWNDCFRCMFSYCSGYQGPFVGGVCRQDMGRGTVRCGWDM